MPSSTDPFSPSSTRAFGHAFTPNFDQATGNFTQLTAGNGNTTDFTLPAQNDSPLLALPAEILVYLLRYLNDSITPLILSTTCHQLRNIYQDKRLYKAQDRQSHLFMYNLATPSLYQALNAKLPNKKLSGIRVPDPRTSEWEQLRNHPLPIGLSEKAWQSAFIQKTYLTAWDFLLQTAVRENKLQVLKLMQIVGKLSTHISNTETYAKKLFNNTFPQALSKELTTVSVDWGLYLVYRHFAWRDVYAFASELDPFLAKLIKKAHNYSSAQAGLFLSSYLTHKPYSSFLHYALERFYIFGRKIKLECKQKEVKALLGNILSDPEANYNASDNRGITPLIAACQNNREALVKRYLQSPHIDVNKRDYHNHTALDYAVREGSLAIIEALLTYGVAPANHLSAFYEAIDNNKGDIANLLWQHAKAQGNSTLSDQALEQALTNYQLDIVYKLIKNHAANPNMTNRYGYSALNMALENQMIALFDLLLQHPDFKMAIEKNHEGKTVLHYINVMEGYSDEQLIQLVNCFIKHGGDCNATDENHDTPLILACQANREALVTLLLQQPTLNINARNKNGLSALVYAVKYGTVTLVQSLLNYALDPDGYLAAFNYAIASKKEEMITVLRQAVEINQDFINQALIWVVKKGEEAEERLFNYSFVILKLMKKHGADPDTVHQLYSSLFNLALREAAQEGSEESMGLLDILLQQSDIKINVEKDRHGNTPLIYAVRPKTYRYSHKKITQLIKHLLKLGVDYNASNSDGQTPLILAYQANKKLIPLLLQQPAIDINARDKKGFSVLAYAIKDNAISMAQDLLNYGLNLDTRILAFNYALKRWEEHNQRPILDVLWQKVENKSAFINQALSQAITKCEEAEYSSVIHKLIEDYGADPNIKNEAGIAALLIALQKKDMALLEMLLQHSALKIDVNMRSKEGDTLLHYAVLLEYPTEETILLIKHLLAQGADCNAVNQKGETPLIVLVGKEDGIEDGEEDEGMTLLTLLLQHAPININAKTHAGLSALDYVVNSVSYYRETFARALLKHGVNTETLLCAFNIALESGADEMVSILWKKVQLQEDFSNQALRFAINKNQTEAAYVLIKDYAANPNTVNACGFSALNLVLRELTLSFSEKSIPLLDRLLSYPELTVNLEKDEEGNTALIYAIKLIHISEIYAEEKTAQLVKRLLEHGADCNIASEGGVTPLIWACSLNQPELAKLLFQYGADINAKDNNGYSALDCAVMEESIDLIQALLLHEVDNDIHLTAFNQAVMLNKDHMADVLLQHAKRLGKDTFINQALARAIDEEQHDIMEILKEQYGAV